VFFLQAHGSCASRYNFCILVMCAMECLLERHFQEPPLLLLQSKKSWGTCYQQKGILFIVTSVEVWKHPMHYSHFVPHVQGIEHVSIRCVLDSSHMNQVEKLCSYFT
jgi:hypothetical protein